MLHAVFLLLFVVFAGDLMKFVPMAALAAILLLVAWGMSELERIVILMRMPKGDRVVLVLTFLLTVLVDLTVAIGVGVTLASLMFMARMSATVSVRHDSADEGDDDSQRIDLPPGVEVFRIDGPFFFGVAGELLDTLRRVGQKPKVVILRMRRVPFLDASGGAALSEFVAQAQTSGSKVILSGVQPQPLEVIAGLELDAVKQADDYAHARALAAAMVAGG
jgi:SulP family sulfate permease